MNCLYCQQPCINYDDDQVRCPNHKHLVWARKWATSYGECWVWAYETTHQNKTYGISYHDPGGPAWRLVHQGNILIKLDYLPIGINPDNIDDKLPMLLTFM